jgi:rSAM/selenodomain-associated transferase 1
MTCTLIVIAKAPEPGRCKTRLTPPCTPEEAAGLARASLRDTLDAVAATPATRRMCVLDGEPGDWLPVGFDVVAQQGDGLDERLAHAFGEAGEPALLIGMDTPQVTPRVLRAAGEGLASRGVDAVLGEALDGGYWAIGLREGDPALLHGVPMSTPETCLSQRERLVAHGLRVGELGLLRDVDDMEDARAVAQLAPRGRFARELARVEGRLE